MLFPRAYRTAERLVVCGMGGSALGTHVLQSVYSSALRVPLTIVNDYDLPASVNRKTLVLLSSYSGNTEEVLAAGREARRRGALITGLTQGGALAGLFSRWRVPWYHIDGRANPSGQPRLGLGYSVLGQLGLLVSMGLIRAASLEVSALVAGVEQRSKRLDAGVVRKANAAKQLAVRFHGTLPILVSGEHLVGSLHAWTNMLNETAKNLAEWHPLPELNHHLLEGLRFPSSIRHAAFVLVDSPLFSRQLRARLRITSQIVEQRQIPTIHVLARGRSALAEALDVLVLAGFVSFYLSLLNNVDPIAIPSVDEFKRRLGRFR